jgi:hypothetical protein
MVYVGHRPVLPGQNSNNWRHNVTGELGVYSNWSLQSSTHLLEDMPIRDHVPGTGYHPHGVLLTQMFLGTHSYFPMELARFSHGGQDAPYLRHAHWEFHGVDSAEVFHSGEWGYDYVADPRDPDRRVFTFSRHSNLWFYGVPSADSTFDGRPFRAWDDPDLPSFATRHAPYEYKGVGDDRIEDPGEPLSVKYARAETSNEHAHQRTQEWFGVASAKAL